MTAMNQSIMKTERRGVRLVRRYHGFAVIKKSLPHEVTGIFERELNKNQPGSKSLTASRSSLSSLMVASILDWLKA